MRSIRKARRAAFTLIEILIVVVILGILAAIVIPQFTNASDDAMTSSVRSQLQTVRSQIELYRVQNGGLLPDFTNNGWGDLTGGDYLQDDPSNPFRAGATTFGIVVGNAVPPAASGGGDTDGWYWNSTDNDMYAIDAGGLLLDF